MRDFFLFFLIIVILFIFPGSYLFSQSRIPEQSYNWLVNSYPVGNGDRDQLNVIFFEVPDSVTDTLYFAVYDAEASGGDPDVSTVISDYVYYLIGGVGAVSDSTSKLIDYSADTSVARAGNQLSTFTVTTGATMSDYDQKWFYFPNGVAPSQGEHIGNKYYFKVVIEGQPAGTYKNGYQLDISTNQTGAPTGLANVSSFAYNWAIGPLDAVGNVFNIYPFVPDTANATSAVDTDFVTYVNFDFDDDEDLTASSRSGYGLTNPSRSANDVTAETQYNIFNTETASGSNERNGTWTFTITENNAFGGGANQAEVWFTLDNESILPHGDGPVLRAYSSAITSPPLPDHVILTYEDGSAMANNADTETISVQIVDSSGDNVNYSRDIYVSLTDANPNPAAISAISNGTNNSSDAIITTDIYGFGSLVLIRNDNGDADSNDTMTVTTTAYWDGSGGVPGNSDTFGTASSTAINVDFIENPPPTLSSATNMTFDVTDGSTGLPIITIGHPSLASGPKITDLGAGAGELRVRIPASLDCVWDTSILDLSGDYVLTGTGTISNAVTYADAGKTLVIEVTGDFAQDDSLAIDTLALMTFGSISSGSLELSWDSGSSYNVVDDKFFSIVDSNVDFIWTGATDTAWNTAGNWNPAGTPGAAHRVLIPSAPVNQPAVPIGGVTVTSMTIESGAVLSTGGLDLTVSSNLDCSGSLDLGSGGTITVSGIFSLGTLVNTSGSTIVLSSGSNIDLTPNGQAFNNLTINSVANTVTLNGSGLDINGILTLQSGTLDVSAADFQVNVAGDWIDTGGSFVPRAGTVVFDGTGAVPSTAFYNLEVAAGGTRTPSGALTVSNDFVLSGGIFSAGALTHQVGGSWDNSGGTFTANTGTIDFTGTGTISPETFYNLTVSGAGSVTSSGTIIVSNDFTLNGGTFIAGANTLQVEGTWNNNLGTFTENTGTVNFTNTGTVNAETFYNLTINGGTRTAAGDLVVLNGFVMTSGVFAPGNNTHQVAGNWNDTGITFTPASGTINLTSTNPTVTQSGTNNFYNLTLTDGAGLSSAVDINGTINISGTLTANNNNMEVALNWINGGTFTPGTGTVTFDGTGSVTAETFYNMTVATAGTRTAAGILAITNNLTLAAGGDFDAAAFTHLVGGNWNNSGGNFTENTSTINFNGTGTVNAETFYNLQVSNGTRTAAAALVVSNNLTLSGTGIFDAAAFTHQVGADWNNSGGTFTGSTSTIVFTGTGNVNAETFYNMQINTGGTRTGTGDLVVSNALTLTSGVFAPGNNTHQVAGNWNDTGVTFTPGNGTINLTSTNPAIIQSGTNNFYNLTLIDGAELNSAVDINGTINISGTLTTNNNNMEVALNWVNSGTFTPGTGTVTFDGVGSVPSETFYNLAINTAGTRTFTGIVTVTNLLTLTAGTFNPGGFIHQVAGNWDDTAITFTPAGGTITLTSVNPTITQGAGNYFHHLTLNNGAGLGSAIDVNGVLDISGTLVSNNNTINVALGWINSGTFTPGTGIVIFDGTGNVPAESFYNLQINGGVRTATGALVVNNNIALSAGTFAAGSFTHQVGGNWVSTAGVFDENTSTISFTGSGSVSAETFYSMEVSTAGTRTAAGALDITNSLALTSGTFDPAAFTHQVAGNWDDTGVTFTPSSGLINLTSTNPTITQGGANNFYSLTLDDGAGLNSLVDINGSLDISGTLTANNNNMEIALNWINSGAFTPGTGTVIFDGTGNVPAETFYNMEINTAGTHTATGGLTVTNSLTLTSGTFVPAAFTHQVAGNWDDTGVTFTPSSGLINLTSTNPAITQGGGNNFYGLTLDDGAGLNSLVDINGSLDISGALTTNNNNMEIALDWINSGTFNEGTGTVTFDGTGNVPAETFYDLVINTAGTRTAAGALVVTNSLILAAGGFAPGNFVHQVAGDWNDTGIGFNPVAGTINLTSTNPAVNQGGANNFFNLTLNDGAGLNTAIDVNGSLDNTGTLTSNNNTINVALNWIENGTFVPGTGVVILDGNGSVNAETFYSLNLSAGARTTAGILTVTNSLSLGTGSWNPGNYTHSIAGNWNCTTITFTPTTGTIELTSANPVIDQGITNNFYNLTINNGASLNTKLDVNYDFTIVAGTFVSNNNYITVVADWVDTGVFTAGTSIVEFSGAGTVSAESFYDLQVSGGTRTVTGILDVANDFSQTGGTFVAGNFVHTVAASWVHTAGVFDPGSGTIEFTGTGTVDAETFNIMTINGGVRTTAGNITVSSGINLTTGTLVPGNFTHQINGNWDDTGIIFQATTGIIQLTGTNPSVTQGGANYFYTLVINAGAQLASPIDVNGDLTFSGTLVSNDNTINLAGSWTDSGSFDEGTGSVVFDGTGNVSAETFYDLSFTAGIRTAAGALEVTNSLALGGGTFNPGNPVHRIAGNWNCSLISFTPASGTIVLTSTNPGIDSGGGNNFYNLTLEDGAGLGNPLRVDGTLSFSGTLTANNNDIFVAGNWDNNGTFDEGTGMVTFNGSGQIVNSETFYNLTKDGNATTTTLNANITVNNNLLLNDGTLAAGANNITMAGIGPSNDSVWQNVPGAAAFNGGTGTVFFNAISTTVYGSTDFYNFNMSDDTVNARTILFENLQTQVINGDFYIEGAPGREITMNTTFVPPGTTGTVYWIPPPVGAPPQYECQWIITVNGTATVDFAVVSNSYAINIIAATSNSSAGSAPAYNNDNWLFVITIESSETLDTDNNGKIDIIRVTTSADLNDNFSSFVVAVEEYEVILPCITGTTANDDVFRIRVREGPLLDTGDTPVWKVVSNSVLDALAANVGGSVVLSGDEYLYTPVDESAPIIGHTIAVAEKNQIFVHFSEPVERAGGGTLGTGDFIYSGSAGITSATAVTTSSDGLIREILLTLSGSVTTSEILLPATLTTTSAFQDALNLAAVPSVRTLVTTTHRVSDIGLGLVGNGLVEPILAFDRTLRDEALGGIGLIEKVSYGNFDGTGWLRDQDIELQARIHDTIDGTSAALTLYYAVNVPGSLKLNGLWLPSFTSTEFGGLVPYPNTPVYGGITYSRSETVVSTQTRSWLLEGEEPVMYDGAVVEFLFKIPSGSPYPLYCGRVADPGAEDWYRNVLPWSFAIHDIVTQAGRVTIMNNVINPLQNELVDLFYVIEKRGPVNIMVFNLAGDIVDVLYRGIQDSGEYTLNWDGRNRGGRVAARGVYFIRVVAPGIEENRKVLVVK